MTVLRTTLLLLLFAGLNLCAKAIQQQSTDSSQSASTAQEDKLAEATRIDAKLMQSDREYAEAAGTYSQHHYTEALPLLERLAVKYPSNPVVMERLGVSLIIAESEIKDPEGRKQQRARGRALLLKVQEQGIEDDLLLYYLRTIPKDGGDDHVFSSQKEVNEAMKQGETLYARADYKGAIKAYTRAMLLDPNLYTAVLFIGDSYFADKQYGSAGEWFVRATQIDPNRETAYRYWGDALRRQGKEDEARSKFIDAIIAEPYNPQAWVGAKQWAKLNGIQLSSPDIKSPNRLEVSSNQDGSFTIPISLNLGEAEKKDGTASWGVYQIMAGAWPAKIFEERFPDEKQYRHTLAEESSCLAAVASIVQEDLKKGKLKAKKLDPGIALLLKLYEADLLDAHILLSRAEAGIAQDYSAYREKNRDKLRKYLDEYVVPKRPAN